MPFEDHLVGHFVSKKAFSKRCPSASFRRAVKAPDSEALSGTAGTSSIANIMVS